MVRTSCKIRVKLSVRITALQLRLGFRVTTRGRVRTSWVRTRVRIKAKFSVKIRARKQCLLNNSLS